MQRQHQLIASAGFKSVVTHTQDNDLIMFVLNRKSGFQTTHQDAPRLGTSGLDPGKVLTGA
jgi:hypothetical protein